MKLFLTSSADKTLSLLKEVAPDIGNKVLFVANASDPYDREHWWVELDRQAFKQLGFNIHEVDVRNVTPQVFGQMLSESNVLHVCGGSVYYIMALLREKKLDEIIMNAIRDDAVVYSGTSAGSIIVSNNLRPVSYDLEEIEHINKVPEHNGLGIINFTILPHANNPDFGEEWMKAVAHLPIDNTALFFLHDNQALWVEDKNMRLLSVEE
jgi:dipeptidase E